jgi:hypothetical protein
VGNRTIVYKTLLLQITYRIYSRIQGIRWWDICTRVYPKASGLSLTKYTLATINILWEATQRAMAAKLTRLTHKVTTQLYLVAESSTICSSRARRPVRKRLDTPSYILLTQWILWIKNAHKISQSCFSYSEIVFSVVNIHCTKYCRWVYQKVSGLAAWSENCKWYGSLPLGAVVSLFCESV